MNELDVYIRNMSGDPDNFFNMLYDIGGLGVLRFEDEFRFLFLREEGGYTIYSHVNTVQCLEKVMFAGGPQNARLIVRLAECADQLFHVRFLPGLNICGIMLGAEQMILLYFPPKTDIPRRFGEHTPIQADNKRQAQEAILADIDRAKSDI
jgi:hypothetical protein